MVEITLVHNEATTNYLTSKANLHQENGSKMQRCSDSTSMHLALTEVMKGFQVDSFELSNIDISIVIDQQKQNKNCMNTINYTDRHQIQGLYQVKYRLLCKTN